ncbi:MAG: exodeoxyribonuclease VII large subunit [Bacteriovoracia bacterium]
MESNPAYWSVSELTARIRGVLEPPFKRVWIRGEVSNFRPAASGHLYFSLKDAQASISAALFGGMRGIKFDLKDGQEVLCSGKIGVYPPRGTYQLVVDKLEPLGAGALQIAFEQLKARLLAEGLFEAGRKRALPRYPRHVSIITSPTGAAVQDILNILGRRAPQLRVTIVPAVVQGEGAEPQLVRALETVNRHGIGEAVILARGGGSLEDLWCFNSERLARQIVASRLPVISAVGHEVDFTISDFVADLRAPTPSAAAELISADWVGFADRLAEFRARLSEQARRSLELRQEVLDHLAARVVSPREKLGQQSRVFTEVRARLDKAARFQLEKKRARFERATAQLDALSPLRVLDRGFSLVRSVDGGAIIRTRTQLQPGTRYRVTFKDGDAQVEAK